MRLIRLCVAFKATLRCRQWNWESRSIIALLRHNGEFSAQLNRWFSWATKVCYFLSACDKYPEYKNPYEFLKQLHDAYGDLFDYACLKSELEVLYLSEKFSTKSVHDTYKYICGNSLDSAIKEIYELRQIILTIPNSTVSAERNFPVLKWVNTFLIPPTSNQDRLSSQSLHVYREDIVIQLKQKQAFYNHVIQKIFCLKENRISLKYNL